VPDADRVTSVTVYSKPGCHLCEEMKALVARVLGDRPAAIEEIDISADADLEARYGLEIPVLLVDGRKVAKYRIDEAELRRILAGSIGPAERP
jgi:glutaredoxin